jgi:hypothetical protein
MPILKTVAENLEKLGMDICRNMCTKSVEEALVTGMEELKDIFVRKRDV